MNILFLHFMKLFLFTNYEIISFTNFINYYFLQIIYFTNLLFYNFIFL
jgi:hypothetical protein